MNTLRIGNDVFEELFSPEQIAGRIQELACQIEHDYAGSIPVMLVVLNGGVIFLTDLVRAITAIDVEIDSVRLKSYGNNEVSSGVVELINNPGVDLADRDVIIVEDIVDSGRSMNFLRPLLVARKARSVRVATLLYKAEAAKLDVPAQYIGFSIPNVFVIGYGLDYKQLKRNLPAIYSKIS